MRSDLQRVRLSFGGSLTPVVRNLIWINSLIFLFFLIVERKSLLLEASGGNVMAVPYTDLAYSLFGLSPRSLVKDWLIWQPITYLFIHRNFTHLLFNMLGLWWFGTDVERSWGSRVFFRYYLLTGIGAAATCVLLQWNSAGITVGASGALFGILLAFGFYSQIV